MEVGYKFECLQDGNFPKRSPWLWIWSPWLWIYVVCTLNMVCYVTHVVAV